jgi:small GTP-binding protein
MTEDQDLLREFPSTVREVIRELYKELTPDEQQGLSSLLLSYLPRLGLRDLQRVLNLVQEQYRPVFAHAPRICIVGPVNTGKSSLYNALITAGEAAHTSPIPGTTTVAQEGEVGLFAVVDTPGADDAEVGDEERQSGEIRRHRALEAAERADLLIMVFDAFAGISRGALEVYQDLVALGKPYVIAFNKIDLVKHELDAAWDLAARTLGVAREEIIPISAKERTNLDTLLVAVVKADPRIAAAVGQTLPAFREKVANQRIINAAVAAGSVNLITSPIPIPFTSFGPLVLIQTGLVLSIARIYGYRITARRAKELIATFGAGFGARTLFQQLVTKVPGPGWVLGTAIAVATTVAIGYAAVLWFDRGEKLTADTAKEIMATVTQRVANRLKDFGKKRPGRRKMHVALQETLSDIDDLARRSKRAPAEQGPAEAAGQQTE